MQEECTPKEWAPPMTNMRMIKGKGQDPMVLAGHGQKDALKLYRRAGSAGRQQESAAGRWVSALRPPRTIVLPQRQEGPREGARCSREPYF